MGRVVWILLSLLLMVPPPAAAGRQCAAKPPAPAAVQKALQLALQTRERLELAQADVALVGRIGSDLSEHGLRYSHMGFVRREHPKGPWLVTHLLNRCGSADSALFDEGLGNFFLDEPVLYEALLVVPSPGMQRKLLDRLASDLPLVLHTPGYSMIAHPFSTRYQNSNQWVLELLAASIAPAGAVASRDEAQRWLRTSGYSPAQIRIGPLRRAGARLFSVNVRFDDHDAGERPGGSYPVVSVESTVRLLAQFDPAVRQQVVVLK